MNVIREAITRAMQRPVWFGTFGWRRILNPAAVCGALAACVQAPYPLQPPAPPPPRYTSAPGLTAVNMQSLPQTIGLEHRDRVVRFDRLAHMYGIAPPQIAELQLGAGQVPGFNHPIPVVRIVFDSKVFFDFNNDTIRPEAIPILDIIAENMRRDVPDATLLVLGHTDAIGSDDYNIDLSRRRAVNVMQGLIARGVQPFQLATVAIGKSQPIAPNSTEEGRARNRRVEFMISASQAANVKLVEHRVIIQEYIRVALADPQAVPVSRRLEVLQPVGTAEPTVPEPRSPTPNTPTSRTIEPVLPLQPRDPATVQLRSVGEIELQKPVPQSEVQLRTPTAPEERPLSDYKF